MIFRIISDAIMSIDKFVRYNFQCLMYTSSDKYYWKVHKVKNNFARAYAVIIK